MTKYKRWLLVFLTWLLAYFGVSLLAQHQMMTIATTRGEVWIYISQTERWALPQRLLLPESAGEIELCLTREKVVCTSVNVWYDSLGDGQ